MIPQMWDFAFVLIWKSCYADNFCDPLVEFINVSENAEWICIAPVSIWIEHPNCSDSFQRPGIANLDKHSQTCEREINFCEDFKSKFSCQSPHDKGFSLVRQHKKFYTTQAVPIGGWSGSMRYHLQHQFLHAGVRPHDACFCRRTFPSRSEKENI